ncbi:MAG: hypothetical protein HQM13_00195 [SAR324 cluster bacterium]|nr:hypothetical protein [SAR324 cluster bacterium]
MAGAEKTIKIKIPQTLAERLNYHAKQLRTEPETAVERLLELHLPNLMGNFAIALESLSEEEQKILEESFYCVMFIVSYADDHASLKEIIKIEKQLGALKRVFGTRMTELLGLDKKRKNRLFETVKTMSSQDIETKLEQLQNVFAKMPKNLIDEYKLHLLDSCVVVAGASKEGLLGDSISEVERTMIQTIVHALEIPVYGRNAKVLIKKPDLKNINSLKN